MFRNYPFLLIGLTIASGVASGCGGDEFGTVDPGSQGDRDGATDGQSPGNDGSTSGGSGGAGGVGGRGGTGGGGSGASGGASGTGGAGATGGSGGGKGSADAALDVLLDGRTNVDTGRMGDVLDAQVFDTSTGSDGPGASDISVSPPDAAGSDVACSEPIVYYKDADGDGFGVSTETTITCTPPGSHWSVLTGDCRDDLSNVKPYSVNSPDPPVYSCVGYADNTKPQGVSFDYDCTGTEDKDPSNAYGPEPACSGPLDCTGVGYAAVNPARTGTGIDPYCGSTSVKRCSLLFANGAPALCMSTLEVAAPYQCR
jgi:hypothetical protein